MTDKLAKIVPKITPLLLIALGNGSTDGERINAIRALQRQLKGANSDSHDLIGRLEATPLSEEEMQRIFDSGIERGRTEEVENARRNAVTIAATARYRRRRSRCRPLHVAADRAALRAQRALP